MLDSMAVDSERYVCVGTLTDPGLTVISPDGTEVEHVRFPDEYVDAFTTNKTIFIRPDGAGRAGETRNWDPQTRQGPVNMPWNAMSFVLGTNRYTVAYLDRPDNPKEARFSEREYGRFGSYFEYTIEKDRPLIVNYRLWLQDGLMKPEEVAALSDNFVNPVQVTVRP